MQSLPFLALIALFCSISKVGAQDTLVPPVFSHPGGLHAVDIALTLSHPEPGVSIVYTLDGSLPDQNTLSGRSFGYKNQFPTSRNGASGPMLQSTYQSQTYASPIAVTDRTSEPNRLSIITTTMPNFSGYFPTESVFKGTVVRARAYKAGWIPSDVRTQSYFVSSAGASRYELPVISMAIQEDELFGFDKGFYTPGTDFEQWRLSNNGNMDGETDANWHRGGEDHPAHVEMFEVGGAPVMAQDVGVRAHGGWSRSFPRKTLRLYARSDYGEAAFRHQVFQDQPWTRYKRLLLRNSGNDEDVTNMRDGVVHLVMKDLRFDRQAFRPAVVFFNGEYWGIHNLRERLDKHYIERKYGLPVDSLDILEVEAEIKEGDNQHYLAMLQYIRTNRVDDEIHYDWVQQQMDVENFIDYQIAEIFARNTDWPGNNIDYWRYQAPNQGISGLHPADGRWRWMFFDADHGFGIWDNNATHNTLAMAVQAGGTAWPNPDWSTFLLRELLRNDQFKTRFVQRYSDLLNTSFRSARMNEIIDSVKGLVDNEMPRHMRRWNNRPAATAWEGNVQAMRDFAIARPGYARTHLRSQFSLGENIDVTLAVNDASRGHIRINTLDIQSGWGGISANPYPWTGTYFAGVPLQVTAVPKQGYRLVRWSGAVSGGEQSAIVAAPQGDLSITAEFEPIAGLNTIAFWHFDQLPEGNLSLVFADTGIVASAHISYPGTGAGYMDASGDGALRVRNPGHTRELVINLAMGGFEHAELSWDALRTESGAYEQSVYYRASAQGEWIPLSVFQVGLESRNYSVNLAGLPGVDNNPQAQVRILMTGYNASKESGNHRIENMQLRGVRNSAWVIPDPLAVGRGPILRSGYGLQANASVGGLVVRFAVPNAGPMRLQLHAASGARIASWSQNVQRGEGQVVFQAWEQAPVGGYFLSMEHRGQRVQSVSLLKH